MHVSTSEIRNIRIVFPAELFTGMLESSKRVRNVSVLFVEHLSEFLFTRIKIEYFQIPNQLP